MCGAPTKDSALCLASSNRVADLPLVTALQPGSHCYPNHCILADILPLTLAEVLAQVVVGDWAWSLYQRPPYTWADAQDQCQGKGGQLVAVRDAYAQARMALFMSNAGVASAWIGLTVQGSFTNPADWYFTATGQSPVINGWASGQPTSASSGTAARVLGTDGQPGKWDNGVSSNVALPYICETGEVAPTGKSHTHHGCLLLWVGTSDILLPDMLCMGPS